MAVYLRCVFCGMLTGHSRRCPDRVGPIKAIPTPEQKAAAERIARSIKEKKK